MNRNSPWFMEHDSPIVNIVIDDGEIVFDVGSSEDMHNLLAIANNVIRTRKNPMDEVFNSLFTGESKPKKKTIPEIYLSTYYIEGDTIIVDPQVPAGYCRIRHTKKDNFVEFPLK